MTDISIKEYIDLRIEEMNKKICSNEKHQTESLNLSRNDLERRLEAMNEFRSQLEKQAANFITRDHAEFKHDAIESKLEIVSKWQSIQEGKHSRANLISLVALIVSLIVGVVQVIQHL